MKSKLILSVLLFAFISSIFSQIPTKGLVLYLPLNGNAIDSSSLSNNGTSFNTIPINDRCGNVGKAMSFDGYSSYIRIPASKALDLIENKTISCWLYMPTNVSQNNYSTILYKDEPIYGTTYALQLTEEGGYGINRYKYCYFQSSNSSNYVVFSKQQYLNIKDQWIHLVGTYDSISGYSKIYFNGLISDSVYVGNKSSNSSNLDLFIGCGKNNGYYSQTFFKGGMDDILIYNRALSAQEIYQIYTEKLIVNAGSNKTVVCGESVKLDSVTTNYTGKGTLKYKWTPSTNLNNDTIPNPISSTTSNITYTVTVTTPEDSTASEEVTVTPKSFSAVSSSTVYKYLTCGESVKFDTILTNYSGTSKLKYKWTPSTGLSSDTIARPICTTTGSKYYTVTITTPSGCSASSYVYVSTYSNSYYYTTYKTVSCGDTVKLEAIIASGQNNANLHYKWYPTTGLNSDTISSPVAQLSSSTNYSYTVTTSSGCVVSTGNVYVTFTKTSKPEITYVNVDNDMNVITWDKTLYSSADSLNIYKETSVANSYSKVATVSGNMAGIFIDSLSSAKVQSNRYKLSILDKCGFETDLSSYHKTMHLFINKGINTVWNLMWEPYEGFTVATYNIYRGTSVNEISQIGSISGGNTQFSDYSAPNGDVYYQIEAVKSTPTSIKKELEKSKNVLISSKSNISTNANGTLGFEELNAEMSNFKIYPNPTKDNFVIDVESQTLRNSLKIKVYNLTGEIIKTNILQHNKQNIDVSNLATGIYYVELSSDASILGKKLLIKK